jgi:hypothetical protein
MILFERNCQIKLGDFTIKLLRRDQKIIMSVAAVLFLCLLLRLLRRLANLPARNARQ